MKQTRILIVDDHPLVRQALAMNLVSQKDFEICGEAESESEALRIAAATDPHLILVDLSLKNGHGIDLVRQFKARDPAVKILVVSAFEESLYGQRALRAGAEGYLNKQESQTKLLEAVQTVLKGQRYISPELSHTLISQGLVSRGPVQGFADLLSNRELEVFRLIGQGHSSGAIAERLFLSRHTIDTHRENIKRKIGAKDAGELNRHAVQWVLEHG
ncbi:MAG: response regulator [Planctomycetota bacterium]